MYVYFLMLNSHVVYANLAQQCCGKFNFEKDTYLFAYDDQNNDTIYLYGVFICFLISVKGSCYHNCYATSVGGLFAEKE